MSAPARTPLQTIVNLMLKYGGNVSAVADDLGMRRASLYERLERANLDPRSFRLASVQRVSGMAGMTGNTFRRPVVSGMREPNAPVRKNAAVRYPAAETSSSVAGVQTAAAESTVEREVASRPARLSDAQKVRLREAKFDWQARFRVEIQESGILQQFFDERFEEWLGGRLAAPKSKSKP